VSHPCTAEVVATGAQLCVPSAVPRETIRLAFDEV